MKQFIFVIIVRKINNFLMNQLYNMSQETEYKEVEWGVPFRYTIENLGQGKYAPVSLQKWIIVNLEEDENYKIYQSNSGTDFEWNENYEILPDEEQFWNLIDEDSPYYNENYLTESNWELVKVMENDIVGISLNALSKDLSPNFKIAKGLLKPSYIDSFQD